MNAPTDPSAGTAPRPLRLADVLRLLVRGAPFALLVTAVAVAAALFVTRASDPVYRASVTLVVSRTPAGIVGLDVVAPPAVDPTVYRSAVFESDVLGQALAVVDGRSYGEEELEQAARSVRATVENQDLSGLIRIEVRDASPERAAALANALADGLVTWDQERARQGLEQSVAAIERALASIAAELATTDDAARTATLQALATQRTEELDRARTASAAAVTVSLLEPMRVAPPPERAIGPRLVLNTAVAGLLGLVGGYGLLLLLGAARPRVLDHNDVVRATHLPLLAQFPRRARGAPRLSDESAGLLRTRLEAHHVGPGPLVVLVVSVAEAEEKDGVAVGLAESFARGGARTLLVDADLRSALATNWLEVNATRATPYDDAALDNPKQVPPPIAVVVEGNRTFDFLPSYSGARHPVDRLARVFRERFPSWADDYEVMVIDTAPLLPHADALTVAASAKGVVVLCAAAGRSARADVEDAVARLDELGTPVLGTVLTNAAVPTRRSGHGAGRGDVNYTVGRTTPASRRG